MMSMSSIMAVDRAGGGLVLAGLLLSLVGGGCQNGSSSTSDGAVRKTHPSDSIAEADPQDSSRNEVKTARQDPAGEGAVPEGMVFVPGGQTTIGIEAQRWEQLRARRETGPRPLFGRAAHPPFRAEVDPFFLDVHPVTVAQFRAFVDATGHTTQAEEFGNAAVLRGGRWRLVDGATWRHPRGPDQPAAPDDHPVTQVSWHDAQAYCEWAGKRLPTEVEWEHAARAGQERRLCLWEGGCRNRSARIEHANTWQGDYPTQNTAEDGYRYTSPVGAFGTTALGLQDMSGNVWEWTASWKRPYAERGTDFEPTSRSERVQRGGSFICDECGGYFVFARAGATPRTSLFHVGVRCAKDPPDG
jgi:sulfatase modifying factor 1